MGRRKSSAASPPLLFEGGLPENWRDFQPGCVLAINLRDFVTFSNISITMGPTLNMIIGPNGAGKSSIVAALAIGLNYPASMLGRSKDLREYVRQGASGFVIEILLRLRDHLVDEKTVNGTEYVRGQGYSCIRRSYSNKTNSSSWAINDRDCPAKAVDALTASLNIQVDNLCQFLPQDRVGEFCRLTPEQLLVATLEASASQALTEYGILSDMHIERTTSRHTLGVNMKELENLRHQNQMAADTIERIREYQKHTQNLAYAKEKVPMARFNDLSKELKTLMSSQRQIQNEMTSYEQTEMEPLRTQIRELKTELSQLGGARDGQVNKLQNKIRSLEQQLEISEEESQAVKVDAKAAWALYQKQLQTIQEKRDKVRAMELETKKDIVPSPDDIKNHRSAELNDLTNQLATLKSTQAELTQQNEVCQRSGQQFSDRLNQINHQLHSMDESKNHRLTWLSNLDPKTMRAYNFLMEHRHEFPTMVGPVALNLGLKTNSTMHNGNQLKQFAKLVESSISRNVLTSFIFTNEDEHERFMRACDEHYDEMHANCIFLKRSAIDESTLALGNIKGLLSPSLRKLGFEGVILELIEAPLEILAALMENGYVHKIPYSLSASTAIDHDHLQRDPSFLQEGVRVYYWDNDKFTVRYSSHNSTVLGTRVVPLKEPRLLYTAGPSSKSANGISHRDQLKQELETLQRQRTSNQETMRRLIDDERRLKDQMQPLEKSLQSIREERMNMELALQKHRSRKQTLERYLADLERLETEFERQPPFSKEANDTLRNLLDGMVTNAARGMRLRQQLQDIELQLSQHNYRYEQYQETLEDTKNSIADIKVRMTQFKQEFLKYEMTVERQQAYAQIPDELEALLDYIGKQEHLKNQKADRRVGDFDAIIADFEARSQEIDRLERHLRTAEKRLGEINEHFAEKLQKFKQDLLSLVNDSIGQRFTQLFYQMNGCIGQVTLEWPVGDEENVQKWQACIKVQFRQTEAPQPLTQYRQSGGERSVTTMLYVLALQGSSAAPFRVVDEINQGMDVRNERLVHRLIVQLCCSPPNNGNENNIADKENSNKLFGFAQNFLVTPKLLTNLDYAEGMTVLCIYNGMVPS